MLTAIHWDAIWNFRCIKTATKKLVWGEEVKNTLAHEGSEIVLDSFFRGQNHPPTFYIRLFNDTPVKADSISDLVNEASGNGYAAQEMPRSTSGWVTLVLDGDDFQTTSSQETFSASGGSWGPVTYGVLTTSSDSSGKLIAFTALSQSRTINDGETLLVTIKVKQS